jgi:hypothetical protein
MPRPLQLLVFGSLLAFAAGCGGGGPRVRGQVFLDDQPLANAEAVLTSAAREKKGPSKDFHGKTDADGNFVIKGHGNKPIPPGKYQILISKYVDKKGREPSEDDYAQLQASGALVNMLPAKYGDPRLVRFLRRDPGGRERPPALQVTEEEVVAGGGLAPPPCRSGKPLRRIPHRQSPRPFAGG